MRHFVRNGEIALLRRIIFGKILRHRNIAFEQAEGERSGHLIRGNNADAIDICDFGRLRQKLVAHRGVADHLYDKKQRCAAKP